ARRASDGAGFMHRCRVQKARCATKLKEEPQKKGSANSHRLHLWMYPHTVCQRTLPLDASCYGANGRSDAAVFGKFWGIAEELTESEERQLGGPRPSKCAYRKPRT